MINSVWLVVCVCRVCVCFKCVCSSGTLCVTLCALLSFILSFARSFEWRRIRSDRKKWKTAVLCWGNKNYDEKTSISYFIASYYTPAGTKYKYDAPVVSEDYE